MYCGTSWRRGFEYKLSLPTIKRGSVHSPGARLCGLIVVLLITLTLCARICFADTSLVARTVFVDSSLQEMPKPKCCTCQSARMELAGIVLVSRAAGHALTVVIHEVNVLIQMDVVLRSLNRGSWFVLSNDVQLGRMVRL